MRLRVACLPQQSQSAQYRPGLTLLEVMLALAILGISIAAVGEIIRIGSVSSQRARKSVTAQMLCETTMSEIAAGLIPADPLTEASFEYNQDWTYTIERLEIDQEGLIAVRVTVQEIPDSFSQPEAFSLTRWIQEIDETLLMEQALDDSTDAESEDSEVVP